MIFFTSDWHFNHDRGFIYEPRGFSNVQEMNEAIIERHNSIVSPKDDVYVLGDLCLGTDLEANQKLLSRLNGQLHITWGNHDTPNRKKMYTELPNFVEATWVLPLRYDGYSFYLNHYPTVTGNLNESHLRQMVLNLYGHTHQNTNFYEDRPYMYHVGVDSHDCYPVPIDDVIAHMRAKINECINLL